MLSRQRASLKFVCISSPLSGLNGMDPAEDTQYLRSRLALTKAEAARALGVSVDFFEEHVMHELRIVRRGRRRLIPLSELDRWLDESAERTIGR
jgi:excisionase family DNA binding protein